MGKFFGISETAKAVQDFADAAVGVRQGIHAMEELRRQHAGDPEKLAHSILYREYMVESMLPLRCCH